ncbi:MAG: DUF1456 family protein [Candidatus Riflebacteria bacterium]|nr:DUF1456 family protein [Candidatus Riflebacteria bacterium]
MTSNDILRRIRYALDISNPKMVRIFKLSGHEMPLSDILTRLAKEDEKGYKECSFSELCNFLDGLIINLRGPRTPAPSAGTAKKDGKSVPARPSEPEPKPEKINPKMTNNFILKKLRIALAFKEEDMLETIKLGGLELSASELGALFRNVTHKNFKSCGDQILRNFLNGLTEKLRKQSSETEKNI